MATEIREMAMATGINCRAEVYEEEEDEEKSIVEVEDCESNTAFLELKVLDCPICYELLTCPVFECDNGHPICSSCCTKLVIKRCPSCSCSIGNKRNRVVEKVLESIKVHCRNRKYGCKETSVYSNKYDHETKCDYSPCSCPLRNCNFVGSPVKLYEHFSTNHKTAALPFKFGKTYVITLHTHDKSIVLQEDEDGVLFVLSNKSESFGRVISLQCIAPSWKEGSRYSIHATHGKSKVTIDSYTKCIEKWDDGSTNSSVFLLHPSVFCDSKGQFYLYVSIYKDSPVS